MKTYLVGGAVRDELLGTPVKDRDFVVVGQTPEAMLARGYKAVGKGFPVFLHPRTSEEYALARTEKKVGRGHCGFEVVADTSVTLEDDLSRRDLTINAIARDTQSNELVDPYGGVADLEAGVLRHVSSAFAEDPLRVLRVARFAARYADRGFLVHPDTMDLMSRMVAGGELSDLTQERVWGEVSKALSGPRPSVFFAVLRACGALAVIAPEVDRLYGVPQVAEHHPEIDTGIHTEMVIDQAARHAPGQVDVAFAALTHDLGKGLTHSDQWPRHLDHEKNGVPPVLELCARWKVPNSCKELAQAVCAYHLHAHRALEMRPGSLLELLENIGAIRQPSRLEPYLLACLSDARGRLGLEDRPYPQADYLRAVQQAALSVTSEPYREAGKEGLELGQAIRIGRLAAISRVRAAQRSTSEQTSRPKMC